MAALEIAPAFDLLTQSAFGLQVIYDNEQGRRYGEKKAELMFAKDCGETWESDQTIPQDPVFPEVGLLKFALVCDPNHVKWKAQTRARCFPPININPPEEALNGVWFTYDMGWVVPATHLPEGLVRFTRSGPLLQRVASGRTEDADLDCRSVPLIASCFKIASSRTGTKVRHPLDKKWRLILRADCCTKRLTVHSVQNLPFWCSRCRKEIAGVGRVCTTCDSYSLCFLCYTQREHPPEHDFSSVDTELQ